MAYRQADEQEIGPRFDSPQSTTGVDVLGKSTLKVIRTPSPPASPSQSSGSEGAWDYEPLPWPSDHSLFKHALSSPLSDPDSGSHSSLSCPTFSSAGPVCSVAQTPQPSGPWSPSASGGLGGFRCTYPGCAAAPFQTQYMLNSHANAHASSLPHFCPVEGCSRGPGGKGFNRKNEMIRYV
jgi:hypothetical protein